MSIDTDEDDSDVEKDGGSLERNFEDSVEDRKRERKENTDVKMSTSFKSTKRAPKTQTAALWQMVKGMEEISKQQEKKSDERLAAMINMEMNPCCLPFKESRQNKIGNMNSCWLSYLFSRGRILPILLVPLVLET